MSFFKNLINEFKAFALKGNMVDLAVGLIVGAAFGAMMTSLVSDVIMPPLGFLMGGMDFSDKRVVLVAKNQPDPLTGKVLSTDKDTAINYGKFINAVIAFLIQAGAIFFVIKLINNLRRKEAAAPSTPPTPTPTETLLTQIRDLLKDKSPPVS